MDGPSKKQRVAPLPAKWPVRGRESTAVAASPRLASSVASKPARPHAVVQNPTIRVRSPALAAKPRDVMANAASAHAQSIRPGGSAASHELNSPAAPADGVVSSVTKLVAAGIRNSMKKLVDRFHEAASPRAQLRRREGKAPPLKRQNSASSLTLDGFEIIETTDAIHVHGSQIAVPQARDSSNSGSASTVCDWELLPTDIEICKRGDGCLWRLGQGGFGEVFKGLKDGVDEVAVKVIRLSGPAEVEQFKREIDLISMLRHRNIVQFYGACIKPTSLYMVTELMENDLFSALRLGPRYQWAGPHGRQVAMGICSGLHYLHSRRPAIVHRDVKSPNVLLMEGIAKLADVGVARTKDQSDMTAQRGFTAAWAAPEVVYRRRATEKIDVWSFGIILWEIVTGSPPRPGHLDMPAWCPPTINQLYQQCVSDDPAKRPSAADAFKTLQHMH